MKLIARIALLSLFCSLAFTNVSIKELTYNEYSDSIHMSLSYPGKCLDHPAHLADKTKIAQGIKYRLVVENIDKDICNGIKEDDVEFFMGDVEKRPATLLISPNADGSAPHQIELPKHGKTSLSSATYDGQTGAIKAQVQARGNEKNKRFYLDVDPNCQAKLGAGCEAIVRDKLSKKWPEQELQSLAIQLKTTSLPRPLTLLLKTNAGETLRIFVP